MRFVRVWKPCYRVTRTEFPSLLSLRVRRWVGCVPTSAYFWRNFDLLLLSSPSFPATLTGRKLIAWATVERVLVIFQRSPRPEIVPESSNIGTAGWECFSTTKRWKSATSCASSLLFFFIQVLYFILILAISDRSIFGSLPKVGRIRSKMDYTKRGWASEWDMVKGDVWWKSDLSFFPFSFRWIRFFFKIIGSIFVFLFYKREKDLPRQGYHIFCAIIINHIWFDFFLSKFSSENTHIYPRILLFLLVSRWTEHAIPSSWREKEETTSERGYTGREIASGRPSVARISSFFDSLNGKLKRLG